MTEPKITEGWGVQRPRDDVAHYYRNGKSLDGRVTAYTGPLSADGSARNCEGCKDRLAALTAPQAPKKATPKTTAKKATTKKAAAPKKPAAPKTGR